MIKLIQETFPKALSITGIIFLFSIEMLSVPYEWIDSRTITQYVTSPMLDRVSLNIAISRVISFLIVWLLTICAYSLLLKCKTMTTIKGNNYSIQIEYGDILKQQNCKRIINFDECFTTKVGDAIADINPNSICGQYLNLHPDLNINQLIQDNNILPHQIPSKYKNKPCYESGTIIPYGNDLLMAFAKLDERGKGRFFSRDEYIECLDLLWKELENYYADQDVCIPILGAGTTTFDGGSGASISKQELLNIMIYSYKLSSHKIKSPYKLRIICKKTNDFSINEIDK